MYSQLSETEPVAAAIGQARCLVAVGKSVDADHLLAKAPTHDKGPGEILAERARLALDRGDYEWAEKWGFEAVCGGLRGAYAEGSWVLSELRCRSGRLEAAQGIYKRLVGDYNSNYLRDADSLRWVGMAAAQYARWNRLSDQFHFLVNELYPDILKLDANYWPAHYEAGLLYLEKFNEPEAAKEFKAALAINPNAAEVHAALAALALQNYELTDAQASIKRALDINPRLLWAHQLKADVQLANFEPADAALTLRLALKLNPLDEQTLGRLAAAYIGIDGLSADGEHRGIASSAPDRRSDRSKSTLRSVL